MLKSRPDGRRPQHKDQRQTQPQQQQPASSKTEPSREPPDGSTPDKVPAMSAPGQSRRAKTPGQQRTPLVGRPGTRRFKQKRFCLFSDDDKSLNSIIEYISQNSLNRQRTTVVTIISKCLLDDPNRHLMVEAVLAAGGNNTVQRSYNKETINQSNEGNSHVLRKQDDSLEHENDSDIQVIGHVDFDNNLVVLTLDSYMNLDRFIRLCGSMSEGLKKPSEQTPVTVTSLLDCWPGWNQNVVKTLLILFSMSHLIVFYTPGPSIDYSLLQSMRVLEMLRLRAKNRISEMLETIAGGQVFSQQWIRECRISCPRALFICDTSRYACPGSDVDDKKADSCFEEQIYILFKRLSLLHGIKTNSQLFYMSDRDRNVFRINASDVDLRRSSQPSSITGDKFNTRSSICPSRTDISAPSSAPDTSRNASVSIQVQQDTHTDRNETKAATSHCRPQLVRFFSGHLFDVQAAFYDNDNKQSARHQNLAVQPRLDDFFNVLLRFKCLLFPRNSVDITNNPDLENRPNWLAHDERRFVDIHEFFDVDNLFSKRHCHKARLTALELYIRGLKKSHRDEASHQCSLTTAVQYYTNQARGSAFLENLEVLKSECERFWLEESALADSTLSRIRPPGPMAKKSVVKTTSLPKLDATQSPAQRSQDNRERDNTLSITRKPEGVVVKTNCQCGRGSSLLIRSNDRKKKLERVDVYRVN